MFDDLTVAENIFMGHMPLRSGKRIEWQAVNARAATVLQSVDADFGADVLLKRLGVAQKHLVEIARALSHNSRIVIMDEPTSALSTREISDLFRIIAQLKAEGRAILFISHKFDEIFSVADRWVCLRDGEHVGEGLIKDVAIPKLVKLMVGRSIDQVFPKRAVKIGAPVLEVSGLSNPTEFADVSFTLHKGEILGFYGLVGAGRSEAMQALFGVSPATAGTVKLNGSWSWGANYSVSGPGALIPGGGTVREEGALIAEVGYNRLTGAVGIVGDTTLAANTFADPSVTPGVPIRPIVWSSMTPSSVSRLQHFLKNVS